MAARQRVFFRVRRPSIVGFFGMTRREFVHFGKYEIRTPRVRFAWTAVDAFNRHIEHFVLIFRAYFHRV